MNDLTSELQELANVDAHSALPVGSPFIPGGLPNTFSPPLTGSGIELRVVRDGTPARRLRINASRCTFGSGEGCTVRLSDRSLQPLHAVILREADRVLIRSFTAAIEVNGQLTSESFLVCGDVFRLGGYLFETLSLPQSPADSAQDQAQRLRFMAAPDPELEAARSREQEMHLRLAEVLQRSEQAESQLESANQVVAELQQKIAELQRQLDAALLDSAAVKQERDAAVRERNEALQQLDAAVQDHSHALRERDEARLQRDQAIAKRSDAIDSEQAAQAKLRQLNQQILQLQHAQAAAESEKLSELSLEAYMSRLLQQMERAPAALPSPAGHSPGPIATDPCPPLPEHQPRQHPAAELPAFAAADEPYDPASERGDAAAQGDRTQRLPPLAGRLASQPATTGATPPAPTLPRRTAWSEVLQVAAVFSCSAIFFYCGQRNPALQIVWYTASTLAAGLVAFSLYDLLGKQLRRTGGVSLVGRPRQLTSAAERH